MGAFQIFDLPQPTGLWDLKSGRPPPLKGTFSYTKMFCEVWKPVKVLAKQKVAGGTAQAPEFVFLSLISSRPRQIPEDSFFPRSLSFFLPLARLFVCLLRGTLSQFTRTVLVLHLSTEVPYCGGPGSSTLIEKAPRLILQKLLQP